jgi:hypothetical protein
MKTAMILFVSAVLFFSCNNDTDSTVKKTDSVSSTDNTRITTDTLPSQDTSSYNRMNEHIPDSTPH